VWSAVDPLGNRIHLTKACWQAHILVAHPIMNRFQQALRETVARPDWIYRSRVDPDAGLYFREYHRPRLGRFYIMAVLSLNPAKKRGFIKTAFPVYTLSKGGELIWPKL
jgi:hypothetical protein